MNAVSREVLEKWEIRKSRKQKESFRTWLCAQLTAAGYAPKVEKRRGLYTSHNVVVGDPDKAKVLLTAHYDTCAVLPFPNFITPRNLFWYLAYQLVITAAIFLAAAAIALVMELLLVVPFAVFAGLSGMEEQMMNMVSDVLLSFTPVFYYLALMFCLWWLMDGKANRHTANDNTSGVVTLLEIALSLPEELRGNVCFVFFDNEERGLLGSNAFVRRHKTAKNFALVLNFDCVSDGDSIQLFPCKKVKKSDKMDVLRQSFLPTEYKSVEVVAGFGFYPSDQAVFAHGVGVCALKKSKLFGWYMDRIHTPRDTVMDEENIAILRAGTLRLLQTLNTKEDAHA